MNVAAAVERHFIQKFCNLSIRADGCSSGTEICSVAVCEEE